MILCCTEHVIGYWLITDGDDQRLLRCTVISEFEGLVANNPSTWYRHLICAYPAQVAESRYNSVAAMSTFELSLHFRSMFDKEMPALRKPTATLTRALMESYSEGTPMIARTA